MITGGAHTCGIDTEDTLFCWGRNVDGETGRSSSAGTVTTPGSVDSATWRHIASGGSTTCGIREDRTLWCWGNNEAGQVGDNPNLGDNDGDDRNVPKQIGTDTWLDVDVGMLHGCAIKSDHTAACWGLNAAGQLGTGNTTPRLIPTAVAGTTTFQSIAVADDTTCAIGDDSTLYCWGANDVSVFGTSTPAQSSQPIAIAGELWSHITLGQNFGCGITTTGALRCWGSNSAGQVGDGTQMTRNAPTAVVVPAGLTWTSVAANARTACARTMDGRVFCWGDSTMGQLGELDPAITTPKEILGDHAWKDVSVGNGHVCLVDVDSLMFCAGKDGFGQLGDGGTSSGVPVKIDGKWNDVATGKGFTCGIDLNGKVMCAGRNSLGQLGTGNDVYTQQMTQTAGALLDGSLRLAAGIDHACAQNAASIYCWGANYNYQLGLAGENERYSAELVRAGVLPTASMHTCAINTGDSHLYCWGTNNHLQVNAAGGPEVQTPTDISPSSQWLSVTAGDGHTCAVTTGNAVFCKGHRERIGQPSPPAADDGALQFVNIAGIAAIDAGAFHTCAVSNANVGYCWGAGYAGQLGQGDTGARFGPVTVPGAWKSFSGGTLHTCGIQMDASLHCWGDNTYGQLGTTSPDSTASPAQVSAGPWRSVSAAEYHTCAINPDGDMFCWGNNNDGQLANGKAWREKLVPVP